MTKSTNNKSAKLNREDLYSTSEQRYFIETTHGIYPIGTFGYLAGFDELEEALERIKHLEHSSPGQLRLVNKQREVLYPVADSSG